MIPVFARPNVEVYLGPPGTGKTKELLDRVLDALESGIEPERVAYVAFTRKAAHEALERAAKLFGFSEDRLCHFRTLHSLAFRELGLSPGQVMSRGNYDEFADVTGTPFLFHYDESAERVPTGGALGDRLLRLYALARASCITVEASWEAYNEGTDELHAVVEFAEAMDQYKRQKGVLDFTDFLDECQTVLDVDLFVLDEAQDNTLQQWYFADRLAAKAGRVAIAGDDDQAIFQWAGADVTTFQAVARQAVCEVLEHSYRLPLAIWTMAQEVVSRIATRVPKSWRPRDGDAGEVVYHTSSEQLDVGSGSWLLLARHVRQLDEYEKLCLQAGVVYCRDGKWSNQEPYVRAIVAYEHMRAGHEATRGEAALATSFAGLPRQALVSDRVHYADIEWPWPAGNKPDWMDALVRVAPQDREYVRSLRRNGESLSEPGRVVISTFHSIKGGEAEHVAVMTDINRRVLAGINIDPDAETRVWFVAVSRAKQSLHIITPRTTRYFEL